MFLSFEIMLLPYVSGVLAGAGDTRKKCILRHLLHNANLAVDNRVLQALCLGIQKIVDNKRSK
jgi:hypothetical protein